MKEQMITSMQELMLFGGLAKVQIPQQTEIGQLKNMEHASSLITKKFKKSLHYINCKPYQLTKSYVVNLDTNQFEILKTKRILIKEVQDFDGNVVGIQELTFEKEIGDFIAIYCNIYHYESKRRESYNIFVFRDSYDSYDLPFHNLDLSLYNVYPSYKEDTNSSNLPTMLIDLAFNRIFATYKKLKFQDIKRGLNFTPRGMKSIAGKLGGAISNNILKKIDDKKYELIKPKSCYITKSSFNESSIHACINRAKKNNK